MRTSGSGLLTETLNIAGSVVSDSGTQRFLMHSIKPLRPRSSVMNRPKSFNTLICFAEKAFSVVLETSVPETEGDTGRSIEVEATRAGAGKEYGEVEATRAGAGKEYGEGEKKVSVGRVE